MGSSRVRCGISSAALCHVRSARVLLHRRRHEEKWWAVGISEKCSLRKRSILPILPTQCRSNSGTVQSISYQHITSRPHANRLYIPATPRLFLGAFRSKVNTNTIRKNITKISNIEESQKMMTHACQSENIIAAKAHQKSMQCVEPCKISGYQHPQLRQSTGIGPNDFANKPSHEQIHNSLSGGALRQDNLCLVIFI